MVSPPRQRDLFPLPLPYLKAPSFDLLDVGRSCIRRLYACQAWRSWANAGVVTLNLLNNTKHACPTTPSRAQAVALDQFCSQYQQMGKPTPGLTPAGAFVELCQESLPYFGSTSGPVPFDAALVSLPDVGTQPVSPVSNLPPVHRDVVEGISAPMLRSADEARVLLEDSGLSQAYIDLFMAHASLSVGLAHCARGGAGTLLSFFFCNS